MITMSWVTETPTCCFILNPVQPVQLFFHFHSCAVYLSWIPCPLPISVQWREPRQSTEYIVSSIENILKLLKWKGFSENVIVRTFTESQCNDIFSFDYFSSCIKQRFSCSTASLFSFLGFFVVCSLEALQEPPPPPPATHDRVKPQDRAGVSV